MAYRRATAPEQASLSIRARARDFAQIGELSIGSHAILADGLRLLDLESELDACVLDTDMEQALVIAQGATWVVLYGHALAGALGAAVWGGRWHQLRFDRARHIASALAPNASFPPRWSVRGDGRSDVRGFVEPCIALTMLADVVRERVEHCAGALLAVPKLRVDVQGTLTAFGIEIDTRADFTKRYVWALGKRNARGDADALILEQDGEALCISTSARPGGWPSIGALPAAAPDFPTPELPVDELVAPATFAAVDGWLAARVTSS
jgi:hypothetical protein